MQSGGPVIELNEREAFLAMGLYLQEFYRQTHGHSPTLMADIEVEPDGVTHDPAAWDDWLSAVAKTKEFVSTPWEPGQPAMMFLTKPRFPDVHQPVPEQLASQLHG